VDRRSATRQSTKNELHRLEAATTRYAEEREDEWFTYLLDRSIDISRRARRPSRHALSAPKSFSGQSILFSPLLSEQESKSKSSHTTHALGSTPPCIYRVGLRGFRVVRISWRKNGGAGTRLLVLESGAVAVRDGALAGGNQTS
jgi:hypothetical protein